MQKARLAGDVLVEAVAGTGTETGRFRTGANPFRLRRIPVRSPSTQAASKRSSLYRTPDAQAPAPWTE